MDFLIAISIFTISLIFSIIKGISIIIPLLIGLFCFMGSALYRGFKINHVFKMILKGMNKSLIVIRIFVLIGIITAIWRSCGTIPFFVYYGTKLINPNYFILFAFILSCIVSFILGTSFGTVGTIGVVLIVLAKGGNVNINIAAGAIFSGAFFGDRCAPTSSSANLVATITETKLYDNVKNMLITAFIPFILSILFYWYISKNNPLSSNSNTLLNDLTNYFNLNFVVILPALIIFILAILKIDVKTSMMLSIFIAYVICIFVQQMSILEATKSMFLGFKLQTDGQFGSIISGGGLISMINVSFIVSIASAYSGIFEETKMLNDIQKSLYKLSHKIKVYPTTVITSIISTVFSCNQTLAIIITHQLMDKIYKDNNYSNSELAIDLENTVVLIAQLIPWSIAIAVPMATLSADVRSIPYAVFLYLVPLTNFFRKRKYML